MHIITGMRFHAVPLALGLRNVATACQPFNVLKETQLVHWTNPPAHRGPTPVTDVQVFIYTH
jgi:hypothetical protein